MPASEPIVTGLGNAAIAWMPLAVFWHLAFAAVGVYLAEHARPGRRGAATFLAVPLLSVAVVAFYEGNPFNVTVFGAVTVLSLVVATRMDQRPVEAARLVFLVPGALLFAFGLIYPHFLDAFRWPIYLVAAPVGVLPCPTLSVVAGSLLMLDGLRSRTLTGLVGAVGVFYGVVGVARLHVPIDAALIVGAALLLLRALFGGRGAAMHAPPGTLSPR